MANKPIILSNNLFDNVVLNPTHIVANPDADDVAGSEVWHIADNLRDVTQWTVAGTNVARQVRVDCGSAKSASIIMLDRRHNLAGKTVRVEASDDAWSTVSLSTTYVIPSSAGGLPTDTNGCVTPDGVWWATFASASHRYWQFKVLAMGASLAPICTGIYLGDSYRFAEYYDAPGAYDYRRNIRYGKNEVSKGAVRVKREVQVFGEVDIHVRLEETDFQALRPHVDRLLFNTHPWWFCLDDSTTEGAGLMRLFQLPGDTIYDPVSNPVTREVSLLLEEVIPSLVL